MAENSLSQAVSFINDNSTMEIGLTTEGQPAARSDIVAYHFKRNHKNVLRDIAKLRNKCPESFFERNFAPIEIDTPLPRFGGIRKDRAYLLTRDGFSLLVMGFTGAEAVKWKLRYIEAFNALEAAALKYQADLAREAGYMQGRDETLALPVMEAERKKGYLEGLKEGQKFRASRDGLHVLGKILSYQKKGLSFREIGKLLGMSKNAAWKRVARARKLGLVPKLPARPVQGNLLEVGA